MSTKKIVNKSKKSSPPMEDTGPIGAFYLAEFLANREPVPVKKLVELLGDRKPRGGPSRDCRQVGTLDNKAKQALADMLCSGSLAQLHKLKRGVSQAGVETLTPGKLKALKKYGITYADMRPDLAYGKILL